jgi:hypothetical protein
MVVQSYARKSVVLQLIINYHVGIRLIARARRENADTCASSWNLIPVVKGLVIRDLVAIDARRRT